MFQARLAHLLNYNLLLFFFKRSLEGGRGPTQGARGSDNLHEDEGLAGDEGEGAGEAQGPTDVNEDKGKAG